MIIKIENENSYGGYGDFSGALVLGYLLCAAGAILWWILLYKSWEAIQDSSSPVTPGKAVGFMFIPFFNLYWQFIAIFGLAKQLNHYCAERGIGSKRVNEHLVLTHCILFCTLLIPFLNFITGIGFLVVFIIVWKSIAETVDLILTYKKKGKL